MIQRWPDAETGDPKIVTKQPVAQVMHLADYDRDGKKTEFYIQTEAEPCGKSAGVLIGLSAKNPRLHAFGTASKPVAPLYLKKYEWEALRRATGPIEITDAYCGDHGRENEIKLRLHWTPDGIDGTRREFTCPLGPRRLIGETRL